MALVLIVLAPDGAAGRTRSSRSDSTRTVQRVSISERGIVVVEEASGRDDGGAKSTDLQIGDKRIVVRDLVRDSTEEESRGWRRGHRGPAIVIDDNPAGMVRVFADAEVPAGERIDGDVVAVFGSVTVEGEVAGDVVAVFGSVTLEQGAVVNGDAVAFGGVLEQAPGAIVNGESVSLGFTSFSPGFPGLGLQLLTVFCGWLLSLLMAFLLTLIFPDRMLRIATTAARRTAASFALGVMSAPLLVISIVLLMITIIGIPFALLLPLVYIFMVWAGQLAASYLLGSRLLRRHPGEGSPMAAMIASTLFVAMFFVLGAWLATSAGPLHTVALFFHLLGLLLLAGLSIIGTGAILLSRAGSRPGDSAAQPAAQATYPVPSSAGPPISPAQTLPPTPTP